jgi:hypothetical protein
MNREDPIATTIGAIANRWRSRLAGYSTFGRKFATLEFIGVVLWKSDCIARVDQCGKERAASFIQLDKRYVLACRC